MAAGGPGEDSGCDGGANSSCGTTSTPGTVRAARRGRPALPTPAAASKKKAASASSSVQGISVEARSENKVVPSEFSTGPVEKAAKPLPFKDPNFVHSGHGGAAAAKNTTWKNLKQILASQRALPWQPNDPNYFSTDAPPPFKPPSKLRLGTVEEFSYIRRLPSEVTTGHLALRKASSILP
uniref:INO80 complex subunit C n=1 Tax=Macaca nemestrina TaxID=9545 RepID=A0A2K6C1A7_MACNE